MKQSASKVKAYALRLPPKLYRLLAAAGGAQEKSVNELIVDVLTRWAKDYSELELRDRVGKIVKDAQVEAAQKSSFKEQRNTPSKSSLTKTKGKK